MNKSIKYPIDTIRHSTAHLLAAAVLELYPKTKLGVGPVIENGFFYDFDVRDAEDKQIKLTPADLLRIDKRMRELAKGGADFQPEEMPLEAAIKFFSDHGQDFKVELLRDLKTRGTTRVSVEEIQDINQEKPEAVSIYWTGNFVDLCRGPHIGNTRDLGAWKLTSLAGAYWRGHEANPQLQRIYGLAFTSQEELDAYTKMLAEAEKRDHRKIGKELGLFTFSELIGAGLPLFTPRGAFLRRALEQFVLELQEPLGYERTWIPHITKSALYATSGHLEKFTDDLFYVQSKKSADEFVLKPMNCPHHTQIYASTPRSYRDLPIRFSEVTTVYRDENTGQLQGLTRVRSLTQDDAHIFCTPDQVRTEVTKIYKVISKFYKVFKMPLRARLSLHDEAHPEKYLGDKKIWGKAETVLDNLLREFKIKYEEARGEAAFYGPKIDFIASDAIGREWQLATIQLDFNLPERFNLAYVDKDGKEKRPVMIHRAILGSVERFLGVLIEHFAGAFPLWLSPVQVTIIPVGTRHFASARKLGKLLSQSCIRTEVDEARETVGYKIRKAEKQKVPYMLVIGDKEMSLKTVAVRRRGQTKVQKMMLLDPKHPGRLGPAKKNFVAHLQKEIAKKA